MRTPKGCEAVSILQVFLIILLFTFFSLPLTSLAGTVQLPQTGQKTCYNWGTGAIISCTGTGQDGELQAGVPWPDPRFTDNGNSTVTDNLTGLMWMKDANLMANRNPIFDINGTAGDGAVTWQHALDYVKKLNAEAYLGHTDWRLPNINELESLINAGQSNTATWLNTQGFSNVQSNVNTFSTPYWSSTTYTDYTDYAWAIDMWNGMENYNRKSDLSDDYSYDGYVWPVRSGHEGIISLPQTGQTTCYNLDSAETPCADTGQDGDIKAGVVWPNPRFTVSTDGYCVTDTLTGLMWARSLDNIVRKWQQSLEYTNNLTLCGYNDWRLPNREELMSLIDRSKPGTALQAAHPFINVLPDCNAYYGFCPYYWSSTTYANATYSAWATAMVDGSYIDFLGKNDYMGDFAWPVRSGQVGTFIYSIIGTVIEEGVGLGGITITLNGDVSATTTTASDGTYSFTGLPNGTYIITPSRSGNTFTPASMSITISGTGVNRVDFSADTTNLPVQLPHTGQTICYNTAGNVISCTGTGQDGEIQAGVPWPDPRFTDNGNSTVTDNLTGLMWTKDANLMANRNPVFDIDGTAGDGVVTWQHALDYVKKLNAEAYLGYTDWRLPNINELERLINAGQSNTATWLNTQGFSNVQSNDYWSSTSYIYAPYTAWIVSMRDAYMGYMYIDHKNYHSYFYVWPVRHAGQFGVAQLWETGQTTCYNSDGAEIPCAVTDQDGYLKAGVAWPSPRFTVSGDCVTDNLTGLMWTKDTNLIANRNQAFDIDGIAGDGAVTWQHALDYVKKLNAEAYLGYTDWRLPNREELHSLTDFSQYNPALPSGHPFLNVQSEYWSSTSYASSPNSAWFVFMRDGYMGSPFKLNYFYIHVWPVRSSQVAPLVHSISGKVIANSVGLGGVTMSLTGLTSATTTTAVDGTYSFPNLSDGNYTITPTLNGYTFTPASKSVTVAGADVTGADFTATSISVDADGDGYSPPQDCNDTNPSIHPGATELCNGIDDNCDGRMDEGCNINQIPVLNSIGHKSINEGSPLIFTISGSDPDGNSLTYSTSQLPAGAAFDPATQTFSWTPDYTQAGGYSVTFTVSDGSLTASEIVVITVNDVPVLIPDFTITPHTNKLTIAQGGIDFIVITLTDLYSNFNDSVLLTVSGLPEGASSVFSSPELVPTASSALSIITAPATHPGTYTLELYAEGGGQTHVVSIQLDVRLSYQNVSWGKITGPWSSDYDGSFGAIASHSTNPNVVFIGSSTNGPGLYKTTDGGKTWTEKNSGITKRTFTQNYPPISKIIISPNNPNVVYLGTADDLGLGHIYKSTDGGETWENVDVNIGLLHLQGSVWDIAVDPQDPNVVYASVQSDGVFKTSNGGLSWDNIYDGGTNAYFNIVRTSPTNSNMIYIAGFTSNEGLTLCSPLRLDCLPQYVGGLIPIYLQRSRDGGHSWEALTTNIHIDLTVDLQINSSSDTIYASRTTYPTSLTNLCIVLPLIPGATCMGGANGVIKSLDGGSTWESIDNASPYNLSDLNTFFVTIDPTLSQRLFLTAPLEGIILSEDSGENWKLLSGFPPNIVFGKTATAGDKLFVLTSAGIFVSKAPPSFTPLGSNVTVSPVDGTTVSFSAVSSPGDTTVTINNIGPASPSGFLLGNSAAYYDIATTATYTAPVMVCMGYGSAQFGNSSMIHLFHYENNSWVDVTTSNDTTHRIICGQVNSLSPFAIFEADTTPPTITTSLSSAPNAEGWYNADVIVNFTCNDTGAGIVTCPVPAIVSTEGTSQVITGTAVDVAGNSASTSVTINLDKTPPVITCPLDTEILAMELTGTSSSNSGIQSFLAGASATDNLVPAVSITNNVPSLFPLGQTTVTFTATDNAGNQGSCQSRVNVISPKANSNGSSSYFKEAGYNAYATFDVKYATGATTPSGSLTFSSTKTRRKIVNTGINSLTVTGKTAVIIGPCTLNGVSGYNFTATVGDNTAPGAGSDTFVITVTGPNGFNYTVSGTIVSGEYNVSQ